MDTVVKGGLPDPFICADGQRVRTAAEWRKRRDELLKVILDIEYGELPPTPAIRTALLHRHNPVKRLHDCTHQQYRINIEGGTRPFWFIVDILIPNGDGPFPAVINGDGCWKYASDEVALEVLSRGYIFATFNRTEIAPDAYSSVRDTALYLVYPKSTFGALSAWAWGYHRVVDFLIRQSTVDASKIAVVGHSRGGKCVLLAGATDERIALTAPNDSGCGGAGCFRITGEGSEMLADLLKPVPYWFSPKLRDYIGKESDLPFDQHSLKALVAPRALLSTEALGDLWANPKGTYATYLAAKEVYRFLGAEEKIGIWYREGAHSHGIDDWNAFLDFADMQFFGEKAASDYATNPFS
ncbi:MAG: hypothetical protein AABZ39_06000 [Spirochaetota bacterium]